MHASWTFRVRGPSWSTECFSNNHREHSSELAGWSNTTLSVNYCILQEQEGQKRSSQKRCSFYILCLDRPLHGDETVECVKHMPVEICSLVQAEAQRGMKMPKVFVILLLGHNWFRKKKKSEMAVPDRRAHTRVCCEHDMLPQGTCGCPMLGSGPRAVTANGTSSQTYLFGPPLGYCYWSKWLLSHK
jgi:hypothetical protein